MKVGFIGLGVMGAPMAGHLLKAGHALAVWARRADSAAPLVAAGATPCPTQAELGRRSQVVFTMVTAGSDVEGVILGPDGLAAGLAPGSVVVDCSTIAPDAARRLAAHLAGRGVAFLDAPVSGGAQGARTPPWRSWPAAMPRPWSGCGPCSNAWANASSMWGPAVPARWPRSDPDDVLLLAPDCYISNGAAHLSVPADVRAGVVMRGIAKNLKVLVLIDIHDHFFAEKAHYSGTDDRDDLRTAIQYKHHLSRYLGEGQSIIAISLLLGRREWAARRVVWNTGGKPAFKYLTVDVLGESLHRYGIVNACSEPWSVRQSGLISRQQSATIKSMRLGIVGGGGTGSIALAHGRGL